MSLVSVIVPVYNAEKYLRKCLDSLVNQTLKDIEIILVDDGSTDSSLEICMDYAKNYAGIKVLTQKNQGPSAARNNALKIACGKYIGFVDSDDFVEVETYENAVKELEENPDVNLAIWGVKVVSNDNLAYVDWFQQYYFKMQHSGKKKVDEDILFNTAVVPWNKLYRNSVIKNHSVIFPEGRLYEDNAFWWKYVVWCKEVIFIDKPLHFYNMREVSLRGEVIHKKSEREADRIFMIEDVYDFYLKNNLINKNIKQILDKLFLKTFTDAYKETSDKISITLLANNLAKKMVLNNSEIKKVKLFGEFLEKKCEFLSAANNEFDAEVFDTPLSETDIQKAVACVKNNTAYFVNDENIKNDIFIAQNKLLEAKETLSAIITDYMSKLSISDEYTYINNFFLAFPSADEMQKNGEVSQIMTNFLSDLYSKQKTDEIIKFGKIILLLYPDEYETYRILGDTYLFLKNEPQIAFTYYKKYTGFIKDNASVLNVMANICGQYGDVFNQLLYKQQVAQSLTMSN